MSRWMNRARPRSPCVQSATDDGREVALARVASRPPRRTRRPPWGGCSRARACPTVGACPHRSPAETSWAVARASPPAPRSPRRPCASSPPRRGRRPPTAPARGSPRPATGPSWTRSPSAWTTCGTRATLLRVGGEAESAINAALLTIHAVAALRDHGGPPARNARGRALAGRLCESPPWSERAHATRPDKMFHVGGWLASVRSAGAGMEKSVDPKVAEGARPARGGRGRPAGRARRGAAHGLAREALRARRRSSATPTSA